MPLDKTKLGTRFTCFSCGTKFYDLNRPAPTCPECGADQNEAPVQDLKALLSRGKRAAAPKEEESEPVEDTDSDDTGTDDDDDGLFDKADDDDDEDDEDDD
jgi:hypothetical protein